MSILTRFTEIMSSNINALLDKCEDPAKMVDQLMRNMQSDLGNVKAETAAIIARETKAKREVDECQSEIDKMMQYAKRAVAAGNDDDARTFLSKKATLVEELTVLQTQYTNAKSNADKMRQMHTKLSNEIQELEQKRSQIKATMATAKMQQKINKMGSSVTNAKNNMSSFSRMEDRANEMLDEANAMASLNDEQTNDIEGLIGKYNTSTGSVEDELAALKNEAEQPTIFTQQAQSTSAIEDELAALKNGK